MKRKALTIRLDLDFHKEVKVRTYLMGLSVQEYVEKLIRDDLKKHEKVEYKNE